VRYDSTTTVNRRGRPWQLGWLPGSRIRQTSDRIYGQILHSRVNWLLMIATLATTVAFAARSACRAYGTGCRPHAADHRFVYRAMRHICAGRRRAIAVAGGFFIVDGSFFLANLLKIADGGCALSFAPVLFIIMTTWRTAPMPYARRSCSPRRPGAFLSDTSEASSLAWKAHGFLDEKHKKVPGSSWRMRFLGVSAEARHALNVQFETTPAHRRRPLHRRHHVAEGLWHVWRASGSLKSRI